MKMAYERYVKRNGKRYGPYVYRSCRDENGKVKSVFVKKGKPAGPKKGRLRFLGKFNSI
ncbi:MAG: hypothetical protein JXC85_02620 [Candidatus Aenigmarchaeota archaeon]|nr:hypothetical protein [Candidatus Aenigmarchaeota archaeon]